MRILKYISYKTILYIIVLGLGLLIGRSVSQVDNASGLDRLPLYFGLINQPFSRYVIWAVGLILGYSHYQKASNLFHIFRYKTFMGSYMTSLWDELFDDFICVILLHVPIFLYNFEFLNMWPLFVWVLLHQIIVIWLIVSLGKVMDVYIRRRGLSFLIVLLLYALMEFAVITMGSEWLSIIMIIPYYTYAIYPWLCGGIILFGILLSYGILYLRNKKDYGLSL